MGERTHDNLTNPRLFRDGGDGEQKEANRTVAAILVPAHGIYASVPGVEIASADSEEMRYTGPWPVIAHPPVMLRQRTKRNPEEAAKCVEKGMFAVDAVRKFGGVLEAPAGSLLWGQAPLPRGTSRDPWGGFTLSVHGWHFGYSTSRATWLYCCGISPHEVPGYQREPGLDEEFRRELAACWNGPHPPVSSLLAQDIPFPLACFLRNIARRCSRDQSTGVGSLEPGQHICAHCGGIFTREKTGRPPKYCNDGCRLAAWRLGSVDSRMGEICENIADAVQVKQKA